LAGGLLFVLAANLPGQLSHDSVTELFNGQTGVFFGFDPPFFVALLGMLERVLPGSGLFVTLDALVFFGSLIALTRLRGRVTWFAPLVALAIVISPLTIIDEGTVWKDIAFANLAVCGFVALAHAAQAPSALQRRALQAIAVLALGFAALTRQNGLLAPLGGAVAYALVSARSGARMIFVRGATAFALALVVVAGTTLLISAGRDDNVEQASLGAGIRVLEQYDIIGTTHYDPNADLSRLGDPAVAQAVRTVAAAYYSPVRSETLGQAPKTLPSMWALPPEAVRAEWTWMVLHDTRAYLQHRFAVFDWIMFAPRVTLCIPAYVGVTGRPDYLKELHLTEEVRPQDQALYNYATYFFFTPVYAQPAYALCALVLIALLALRRSAADIVIALMLLSALAFAATFFVISLACDFRYLFFLDAATMAGVLYLACDPPVAELARFAAGVRRRLRPPVSGGAAR
jgi:hypothetical protein